jgi:hypothetical protein
MTIKPQEGLIERLLYTATIRERHGADDDTIARECREAAAELSRLSAIVKAQKEALEAESAADEADEAYLEILDRAEAEGWLNDPTGGSHVAEAGRRANEIRAGARALRETLARRARAASQKE